MSAVSRAEERYDIQSLAAGLGPDVQVALGDPQVVEVMLNPDATLWVDHRERGLVEPELREPLRLTQVESLFRHVASLTNTAFSQPAHPVLEVRLPYDGGRLEGLMPPVVEAPAFALRKHADDIYPLESYLYLPDVLDAIEEPLAPVQRGPEDLRETLGRAIGRRANIVISGGVGTAKTSFMRLLFAMVGQIHPQHRILVLEDTPEIGAIHVGNHVLMRKAEAAGITLARLVEISLRLRPDRIAIGESRGPEALDLLGGWIVGSRGGFATIHADSAEEVLPRLEYMCGQAGRGEGHTHRQLISKAVDVVIHMRRGGDVRGIAEVLAVEGMTAAGGYRVRKIYDFTDWRRSG